MNKILFPQRKAVRHGVSLFVNMPAQWVAKLSIKKGDSLNVEWNQEDGSLIIRKQEA